jgi:hypothetical protein
MIDQAIAELAPVVGTTAACTAVGRARATHYRWHRKSPVGCLYSRAGQSLRCDPRWQARS